MTEYLKVPYWGQKMELKDWSISESFEELLSWNLESKLITPKYITGTYFCAIMAIFNFSFWVCFLYVKFFITPERAPKARPATCFFLNFGPIPAWPSYKAHFYKKSVLALYTHIDRTNPCWCSQCGCSLFLKRL